MQNLVDDFMCALQKRVLLQGRMYVFDHHVCFYSNLFGYVKAKIIPLKVRRRQKISHPYPWVGTGRALSTREGW